MVDDTAGHSVSEGFVQGRPMIGEPLAYYMEVT